MGLTELEWFGTARQPQLAKPHTQKHQQTRPLGPDESVRRRAWVEKDCTCLAVLAVALFLGFIYLLCQILII